MTQMQHFLIEYDHAAGKLLRVQEFGTDSDSAVAAYAALELAHRKDDFVEIVLIGSDSLETVKLTHANYFDETVTVSKYLAGIS